MLWRMVPFAVHGGRTAAAIGAEAAEKGSEGLCGAADDGGVDFDLDPEDAVGDFVVDVDLLDEVPGVVGLDAGCCDAVLASGKKSPMKE